MSIMKMCAIEKTYQPKTRSPVHALRGIDLEIEPNELIALQGKSGSGKSTLLHIMGCIDVPSKGTYYAMNKHIHKANGGQLANYRNRKFGFILQQYGLINDRKVWENVALPLMFSNAGNIKSRAVDILTKVGLEKLANRRASDLSGGEQQRVAIARAIINDPQIILADEPTGNLDTHTADMIFSMLKTLQAEGKTIIIATHDNELARRCERIIYLRDGLIER